jgi:cell division septation protein DedD
MADPVCHYCERIAEAECATCGRLYCPDHGADVCLRCMAPESAAPGAMAYRGSLVALGLASIVAVFLLVNPPQDAATVDEPRPVATNTPAFQSTATPTPENGNGAPARPTTTIDTPTPQPEEPTPTPAASGETTYTVQLGDTLSGIAAEFDVSVDAIMAANPDIDDPASILPGQEIIIPAP